MTVSVDAYVTDPDDLQPVQQPGRSTRSSAPSGCSTRWAARAPSTTCAGSPATRPTPTATSGFKNVLKDYPNIKVVPNADGVATGWDPATATKLINDFIASGQYDTIQGIWTSGMDSQVVDAIKAANKKFVPIVGADLGAFVNAAPRPDRLSRASKGVGRDQHRRRRRRRRRAGAQAPQRRDGRDGSVGQPAEHRPAEAGRRPTTRPTPARPRSSPGSRSRARPDSGRSASRSTDWTTYTPDAGRRLQGPGRVALPEVRRSTRGCRFAGIPCASPPSARPMTLTATDLLLEATGISKTYGAVVALQVRVRWPCARARSTP